jgi:hypothetical protein
VVDPCVVGVCGGDCGRKELAGKDFVLGRELGFRYVFKFVDVLRNRPCLGAAEHHVGGVREINLWRW